MTLIEKFNEVAELANVAPIPEVFGLSGREEELATQESEAERAIRIAEEKADWDSSFGYDELRDNDMI